MNKFQRQAKKDPVNVALSIGVQPTYETSKELKQKKNKEILTTLLNHLFVMEKTDMKIHTKLKSMYSEKTLTKMIKQPEKYSDVEICKGFHLDIPWFQEFSPYVSEDWLQSLPKFEENQFTPYPLDVTACKNIEEDHIIMMEPRTERDNEDPYISFLLSFEPFEYITFFASELESAFEVKKDETLEVKMAVFRSPCSYFGPKSFSYKHFSTLKEHLEWWIQRGKFSYLSLLDKMNDMDKFFQNQQKLIYRFKDEFQTLRPEGKISCLKYFVHLFLLGQYLRWWKGPSTPYLYVWKEKHYKTDEENSFREQMVVELLNELHDIINQSEPVAKSFLKQLKWLDYDLKCGSAKIGDDTLLHIYKYIRLGDFCMADASDRFIKTGVAFIFYLVLNYELSAKPTEEMYKQFSQYVNMTIYFKNKQYENKMGIVSNLVYHDFIPLEKFGVSGHEDPNHYKLYEK